MDMGKIADVDLEQDEKEYVKITSDLSGVWALYGDTKKIIVEGDKATGECLRVGRAADIRKEILKNISYLKKKCELETTKKSYINQFGKELFEYKTCPPIRHQIYQDIVGKYLHLTFVLVKLEKNPNERRKIVKEYAEKHGAIYWKKGRA